MSRPRLCGRTSNISLPTSRRHTTTSIYHCAIRCIPSAYTHLPLEISRSYEHPVLHDCAHVHQRSPTLPPALRFTPSTALGDNDSIKKVSPAPSLDEIKSTMNTGVRRRRRKAATTPGAAAEGTKAVASRESPSSSRPSASLDPDRNAAGSETQRVA